MNRVIQTDIRFSFVSMMMSAQSHNSKHLITFALFLAGSLLNFLPLLLNMSLKDPSTNSYPNYFFSLSNFGHTVSLVASISANVFILIDYIFDCFLRSYIVGFYEKKLESGVREVYVPLRESVIYLLIPDLLILFYLIPYERFDIFMLIFHARDTMYVYSILRCLVNFSNPVWTWNAVLMIGAPFMMSNLLKSFATIIGPVISAVLRYVFTSLGLFSYVMYVWWWILYIVNIKEDGRSNLESILCSAYVLFFAVFLFGTLTVSYIPAWSLRGASYFTWYAYLMAGCTLCMAVMSSCCAKLTAAETKVILLLSYCYFRYSLYVCMYVCMYVFISYFNLH